MTRPQGNWRGGKKTRQRKPDESSKRENQASSVTRDRCAPPEGASRSPGRGAANPTTSHAQQLVVMSARRQDGGTRRCAVACNGEDSGAPQLIDGRVRLGRATRRMADRDNRKRQEKADASSSSRERVLPGGQRGQSGSAASWTCLRPRSCRRSSCRPRIFPFHQALL